MGPTERAHFNTHLLEYVPGISSQVGRKVELAAQNSVDGSLSVLSTKWRLWGGNRRYDGGRGRGAWHGLTAPVSMSYMSVPRLHQSTALP